MTDYLFNEEVISEAYKKSLIAEGAQSVLDSLVSQGIISPQQAAGQARQFQLL